MALLEQENIDSVVFKFMNRYNFLCRANQYRLSDFFFVSARYVSKTLKRDEILYRKSEGPTRRSLGEKW